ncbi:MAG: ribbon-helix-helix protein, CopG family [Euryarchaeota archaeon]|nr:ribbon-helix-helix protein, CopG family [Euryarchaeota archaeon]
MKQSDKYRSVRLPEELIEKIEDIIKNGNLGYKSKSEFIKEAIREKLDRLKDQESK